METQNENKALRVVQWLSDRAIDGVRPLSSARDLADEEARVGSQRTIDSKLHFFAYPGRPRIH